MSEIEYYFPEQLCLDLEKLLCLDPSKEEQRNAWQSQAALIRARLSCFLDLDRSVFSYARDFVDNAHFASSRSTYYQAESKRIRNCIASYRQGNF